MKTPRLCCVILILRSFLSSRAEVEDGMVHFSKFASRHGMHLFVLLLCPALICAVA